MLYFECFSGVSGDMSVAALLDLGVDEKVLRDALATVPLDGYEIRIDRTEKCGISACSFDVIMHDHNHSHEHTHNHEHDHEHEHNHHDHTHHHRNIDDILHIIESSGLTERAKLLSKQIFAYIAKAESEAHNIDEKEVHFHEVGAVDSIVDVLSVAICIDALGIEKVAISTLHDGQGHSFCQHGRIPVPVPAVLHMAQRFAMPLKITETKGEMITPTGMGIVCALKTEGSLPENYTVKAVGLGAGKKDFPHANILRVMHLDVAQAEEKLWRLESNIDDSTPQALAFVMEQLFEVGARDVYFTPVFMKKNRPATMISVICDSKSLETMEDIIFRHSSTIGIRRYSFESTILTRTEEVHTTPYGECRFKVCVHKGNTYSYPEYEDVKKICSDKGLDFRVIHAKLCAHIF